MIAFKTPFYPTGEQKAMLAHCFGVYKWVYNMAVYLRSDKCEALAHQNRPFSGEISKAITELKKDPDHKWLADVPATLIAQALRDSDDAFDRFFKGEAGFPRFKKRSARQHKCRFQLDQRQYNYEFDEFIKLPKLGNCKIKWSRKLTARPKMATVKLSPSGKYSISFAVEQDHQHLPKTGKCVGIDLGITSRGALSNGHFWNAVNQTKKHAKKLASAQRKLAKKKIGSNRREKQRLAVARIHEQITNARLDQIHQFTHAITSEFDVIAVETLRVKNMIKNRKLAKALADASFGEIIRQLEYKSKWRGKQLIKIDQWFASTKTCSGCGRRHDMPLSVRTMNCACGTVLDRDTNAALNILAEGIRSLDVEGMASVAGSFGQQVDPMKRYKIKQTSSSMKASPSGRRVA